MSVAGLRSTGDEIPPSPHHRYNTNSVGIIHTLSRGGGGGGVTGLLFILEVQNKSEQAFHETYSDHFVRPPPTEGEQQLSLPSIQLQISHSCANRQAHTPKHWHSTNPGHVTRLGSLTRSRDPVSEGHPILRCTCSSCFAWVGTSPKGEEVMCWLKK